VIADFPAFGRATLHQSITASYDGRGNVLSTTRSSTGQVSQAGNILDGRLLVSAVTRDGGGTESAELEYDDAGRVTRRLLPGSEHPEELTWDPDDMLHTITTRLRSRDGAPSEITYERDAANRVVSRRTNAAAFGADQLARGPPGAGPG